MKIKAETVNLMREAIAPLDTEANRQMYWERKIPRANNVKDLDKRYRWDLLYASQFFNNVSLHNEFMEYDDTHIDTALRSIVKPLQLSPNASVI